MISRTDQWLMELFFGLGLILLVGGCGSAAEAPLAAEELPQAEPPVVVEEALEVDTPTVVEAEPPEESVAAEAPTVMEMETSEAEIPTAQPEDAASAILESALNLKNLRSYRSKVLMETGGQVQETIYAYVLPDRFHMVSPHAEMIGIGADLYMKEGETWIKMPGGGTSVAIADVGVTEENILEARLEGPEDVEGMPCQKYVYKAKMEDSPPMEVATWIGLEDGLPHKIVTKPQSGMIVTQLLFDVNADIKIEAPTE